MRRISMAVQKGVADAVNTRIARLKSGVGAQRDESIDMDIINLQSTGMCAFAVFGSSNSGDNG